MTQLCNQTDTANVFDEKTFNELVSVFNNIRQVQLYMTKLNEQPERKVLYRALLQFVRPSQAIELRVLLHKLIDGYENDLYRALIEYKANGVRPDFSDSRVLQVIFDKACKCLI